MDSSDGRSLSSEQRASKKNSLRKAILMMALESNNLDEHLDSTKKCFRECVNDLKTKTNNLESRMKDIEFREEEFCRFQQTQLEEFKIKEEQLAEIRKRVADEMEEVVLKEEKLSEQTKATKVLLEKFQVEKQEFKDIQKSVGVDAIRLEKKKIEDRSKELIKVQDWIERRVKEIDSKEETVEMREKELKAIQITNEERCQELDIIAHELHSEQILIKERSQKLVSKENQLDSVQKYIRTSFYDFHARSRQLKIVEELLEKQLEDQSKAFESVTKQLEDQFNDFELKKKQLEERCKNLKLKEKRLKKWVKYLKIKQKRLDKQFIDSESKDFDLLVKQFEERTKDLVLKETQFEERTKCFVSEDKEYEKWFKDFEMRQEQLEEQAIFFDLMNKKLKERSEDLVFKEKQLEERSKDLVLKETQLEERTKCSESKEKEYEKWFKDFEMKQKQHEEREIVSDLMDNKLKEQSEELVFKEKQLEERSKELSLKETQLEERTKCSESNEKEYEKWLKDFELKQKQLEERAIFSDLMDIKLKERSEELVIKEKQLEERSKDHVLKETQLDERTKCLESKEMEYEKWSRDFEMKQKQLEERAIFFDLMGKKLKERSEELVLKVEQLKEQIRESESKEKGLENVSKEIVKERNHFDNNVHSHVGIEQVHDVPLMDFNAEIHVLFTFDGLKLNMTEHFKDYESLSGKVCKILQLSLDPSNLVLDVIDGFYPSKCSHMGKGEMELKMNVVRRSCMIFLEQLMELSPQIHPHVKKRALGLADKWKVNLGVVPNCPLEVLAYIQLLASFKLASNYNADEILQLLKYVPVCKEVPKIIRSLGLQEKTSGLAKRLIKDNQHLEAIKYIAACGLVDMFPPVPLLKDYLNISKITGKTEFEKKDTSSEAKDREIDDRVACVRAVIRCIIDNKIECGNWCSDLKEYIKLLQKRKGQKRTKLPDFDVSNPPNDSEERKHVPYVIDPSLPEKSTSEFGCMSTGLAHVLANMDGDNLLLFLRKHVEMHKLLIEEVSVALRMMSDSGEVVLNATLGFLSPIFLEVDSDIDLRALRSCIFLLDILTSLEPVISSEVKEASKKLAVDWKVNPGMREENSLLALGYSSFLRAFGLTSGLSPGVLLDLDKHTQPTELDHTLVCTENLPENIVPNYKKKINQLQQCDGVPEYIWRASVPAKFVLDAIEGCYYSKLGSQNMSKVEVLKSLRFLLSRLLKLSVEVTKQIKEQATKVAAEWKEKVKRQGFAEIWCFLFFLATYKLTSSCNNDELLDLLEVVFAARKTSNDAIVLLSSLGLEDEVPNFIKILVERGLHLNAIQYICAFELCDKFPPATLLEGYISYEKAAAAKICAEGGYSTESKANAAKIELIALEAVVSCSERHMLETQYPLNEIKARIEQLKKKDLAIASFGSFSASHAQPEQREDIQKKCKGFGPEHSKNAPFHHLRAVKLPRPTFPKLPCHPLHSAYPRHSFPDLIPRENYYSPVGSTYVTPYMNRPPFGFGNEHNFGFFPNYHAGPEVPSHMHWRPPARDQRHWR